MLLAVLPSTSATLEIPPHVQNFYNELGSKPDCVRKLSTGFHNSQFEPGDMSYCGDHLESHGIIYLLGPHGKLSNLDIDCDGHPYPALSDRCLSHTANRTFLPSTSIRYLIEDYDVGIPDLNSHIHSFVVFGNTGPPGWNTFDPREYGVERASLMMVVCGGHMFYGIWGDTNGAHGPRASVGETSLSLATACFGEGMSGGDEAHSSHDEPDVLYVAFTGRDAVPGRAGAKWKSDSFEEFHASIEPLGNRLVKRIGEGACSWPGHCEGAMCRVAQDCADNLVCLQGECGSSWPGHCFGALCDKAQDCADATTCVRGRCA